MTPLSA